MFCISRKSKKEVSNEDFLYIAQKIILPHYPDIKTYNDEFLHCAKNFFQFSNEILHIFIANNTVHVKLGEISPSFIAFLYSDKMMSFIDASQKIIEFHIENALKED